jgi:hypothetical protein
MIARFKEANLADIAECVQALVNREEGPDADLGALFVAGAIRGLMGR